MLTAGLGIALLPARSAWLGAQLDAALAARMTGREGTDVAGERAECHTVVFDGPLGAHPSTS